MTDEDREAFEAHYDKKYTPGYAYPASHRMHAWEDWQAARNHYASKLTEAEAVEAAARAICESRQRNHSFDGLVKCLPGSSKLVKYRDYATAALKAAGIQFKEET